MTSLDTHGPCHAVLRLNARQRDDGAAARGLDGGIVVACASRRRSKPPSTHSGTRTRKAPMSWRWHACSSNAALAMMVASPGAVVAATAAAAGAAVVYDHAVAAATGDAPVDGGGVCAPTTSPTARAAARAADSLNGAMCLPQTTKRKVSVQLAIARKEVRWRHRTSISYLRSRKDVHERVL